MPDRRMRQSLMGDADNCLRKVQYSLDPAIAYGTGEARIVGTAYHAGLQALYLARVAGEPCGPTPIHMAAYNAFKAEIEAAGGIAWESSEVEALGRVRDMTNVYIDENHAWPEDYTVLGVELQFTEPWITGWEAHGTVDLVLRGPDGVVVLVDHKTAGRKWPAGKESARKNNQASWYQYWWFVMSGEMPRFAFDVMTYKGVFERRYATRTSEQIQATITKASQIARLIDLTGAVDLPGNPSSNLCSVKYCDHWSYCPYGAAMADPL